MKRIARVALAILSTEREENCGRMRALVEGDERYRPA